MNKFIKINNLAFAILFAIIAVTEVIGFITGHGLHCLFAAIVAAVVALLLFSESKQKANNLKNNNYERNVQNY